MDQVGGHGSVTFLLFRNDTLLAGDNSGYLRSGGDVCSDKGTVPLFGGEACYDRGSIPLLGQNIYGWLGSSSIIYYYIHYTTYTPNIA